MQLHVLGSAAGGGFPQWNCNCHNCKRFRSGDIKAKARTQSSITVSANGKDWVLINTSPDIRAQLAEFAPLQPARQLRDTGITGIILVDAQIDHTAGLLMLREGKPLDIYCSEPVYQDLTTGFPAFSLLDNYCKMQHHAIPVDGRTDFCVKGIAGISFCAVPLTSKAPPYSPHRNDPHPGDNIGLRITDTTTGKNILYAPGLGTIDNQIFEFMKAADCLLVDGTVWTDDEMQTTGAGTKLANEMGHLHLSGDNGILAHLQQCNKARKILIHINNTNPILDEASAEYQSITEQNVEVAYDGMHIEI